MNQEIIDNINLRSKYSRQWRYARKNGEPDEVIESCKKRYFEQQSKTSIMLGNKKSSWEEKKIEETWKDGKKFWTMVELLGKTKEKDEETFVFTEEGNKKEIMTYTKEYTEEWKKSVYQKTERIDFSFWYGNNTIKRLEDEDGRRPGEG